jgi:hypothetical protein
MSFPSCTLVTANFYFDEATRPFDDCYRNMKKVLEIPCYMVIYLNEPLYMLVKRYRDEKGFGSCTHYIVMDVSDIQTYGYKNAVEANRAEYWPTADPRAGVMSHLITCNKFSFVLQAMDLNIFDTRKFAWIDANVGPEGRKIARDGFSSEEFVRMVMGCMNDADNAFRLQILGVVDKKYKEEAWRREYYERYRWLVCGCFFVLGQGAKDILQALWGEFIKDTSAGEGHGEEMLYLRVLDNYYDRIVKGYGDYCNIVQNFVQCKGSLDYVYNQIISRYRDFGYHRECYDCCHWVLRSLDSYIVVDYEHYCKILFQLYVSSYYHKHEEAKGWAETFAKYVKQHPLFRAEYEKNKGFIDSQLAFIGVQISF